MEAQRQPDTSPRTDLADARRHPRYRFDVEIHVRSRTSGQVSGRTVDISESGISAMLTIEVPVGEVVQLGFVHPLGPVSVFASVRHRSAFRYGFQFVDSNPADGLIEHICYQLATQQTGGKHTI